MMTEYLRCCHRCYQFGATLSNNRPCSLQGMACVRSGQAAAWPLVLDRSVRRGSGVKHDFSCAFTRHLPLCSLPCD